MYVYIYIFEINIVFWVRMSGIFSENSHLWKIAFCCLIRVQDLRFRI